MLQLWLHTQPSASAVTPSVMLSVVAHVALIGAAVIGTEQQSLQLVETIAQRAVFLPPPDRQPHSDPMREQIRYVEVGNGVPLFGVEGGPGTPPGQPAGRTDRSGGGQPGADRLEQPSAPPLPSADSVYSILEVEEFAVRAEGSAAPAYPLELIKNGVEGSVLTNFVVDTTGRADTSSMTILESSHPLFVASVREALLGMRFSPASIQGRKVRQLVEQRFQFRITPSTPVSAPAEHTRTSPIP